MRLTSEKNIRIKYHFIQNIEGHQFAKTCIHPDFAVINSIRKLPNARQLTDLSVTRPGGVGGPYRIKYLEALGSNPRKVFFSKR